MCTPYLQSHYLAFLILRDPVYLYTMSIHSTIKALKMAQAWVETSVKYCVNYWIVSVWQCQIVGIVIIRENRIENADFIYFHFN